ncbi:MAG: response regulator [Ktedonobacteraceae bacterium]|nr:response regulator [Ktedonobacteraceae bacterium]
MRKVTFCPLAPAERSTSESSPQLPLVMVIDDSPTVRSILEVCLSRAGYQVKSFHDGVEALLWLGSPQARLPELVFLDIGLPKMDGFEVALHLKGRPQLQDTVIVMLTRRDGVIERLKAKLVGAKDYMVKPFKPQQIVAVVQAYLGMPASSERYH